MPIFEYLNCHIDECVFVFVCSTTNVQRQVNIKH